MAFKGGKQSGGAELKQATVGKLVQATAPGVGFNAKGDVSAADQAWLAEAQNAWESSRELDDINSVAAQEGDLVVDLADTVDGVSAVGESLIDAAYPVAEENAGASSLLEPGATAGAGAAGSAGAGSVGLLSGAGGWVAGAVGGGLAAAAAFGGSGGGPGEVKDLRVISDDQEHGGTLVSEDLDAGIPAHYENIRVLTEDQSGRFGGDEVLVRSVNTHDVAVLDADDALIQFSSGAPTDITVRAEGARSEAWTQLAAEGTVGDITVVTQDTATGSEAGASMDLDGDIRGDINVTSAGDAVGESYDAVRSSSYLFAYAEGGVSGDITVQAEGDGSRAGAWLYATGDVTGDITAEASGDVYEFINGDGSSDTYAASAYVMVHVEGDLTGDVTVGALGDDSYATAYAFVEGSLSGDVTVEASGEDGYAAAYAFVAGSLNGDVTVEASGEDGYATAYAFVEGSLSGDVTVEASGYDSYAAAYAFVEGTLSGDVTVEASGENAYALAELWGAQAVHGDFVVTASGNESSAGLALNFNVNDERNYIDDGGDDQYDGGNYISTDFQRNIFYTPEVLTNDAFGAGSEHVFVYEDAMFALLVTGNQSDTFSLSGDLGADGSGSEDLVWLGDHGGFTAYAYRTYDDDPSINRLFIYEGSSADVTIAPLDGDTGYEDFTVSGLSDIANFSYVALFNAEEDAIESADLTTFFQNYVDNVLKAGGATVASVADALSSFYDADTQDALRADLPALYEDFDFALPEAQLSTVVSGNTLTVTAEGQYAYAYAYVEQVQGTMGAIEVQGSGDGSWAEVELEIKGSIIGDINVAATGDAIGESYDAAYAYAGFDAILSAGGVSGDITVEASGNGSKAELYLETNGDITGGITLAATGGVYEFTDENGYADYYRAYAYADVDVGGNLTGDISVNAEGDGSYAHLHLSAQSVQDIQISAGLDGSAVEVDVHVNVSESIGNVTIIGGESADVELSFDNRFANQITLGSADSDYDGDFDLYLGVGNAEVDASAAAWEAALDGGSSDDVAFLSDHLITISGFAQGDGWHQISFENEDTMDEYGVSYDDGGSFDSIASFLISADAALDSLDFFFGAVDTDGVNGVDTGFLAVADSGSDAISYLIRFEGLTTFDSEYLSNTYI